MTTTSFTETPSAAPVSPAAACPAPDQPAPAIPLLLPPTERDFEIFHALQVEQRSTRDVAKSFSLSQTRVRQLVRRVSDWLLAVLPAHSDTRRENEVRLARHLAADRYQHHLELVNEDWQNSGETRFMSLIIRLIGAQARLGVLPGRIEALAADTLDGLIPPPPQDQSPPAAVQAATAAEPGQSNPCAPGGAEASPPASPPSDSPPRPVAPPGPMTQTRADRINFLRYMAGDDHRRACLDRMAQAEDFLCPKELYHVWAYEAFCFPDSRTPTNPLPRDCSAWNELVDHISAGTAHEFVINRLQALRSTSPTAAHVLACHNIPAPETPLLTGAQAAPVLKLRLSPDQPPAVQIENPPDQIATEQVPTDQIPTDHHQPAVSDPESAQQTNVHATAIGSAQPA